ncbi:MULTISPECIES: PPE family protein [Mycobacterium]|nr:MULTISPECIES: PPE family protein [Mycobacterium]ARR80770.1 PPE family protein [Mycobacterium intracellulare subsp. yongonense]ARR85815.1 PPE family protein [Mycobacterium intracellulare subsp. yongonense]KEF98776.1 hypothetical protein K883_01780 [Mycobacterium sp. TKK-01-0059]MCA2276344.1 PPE family protein [Mycobacterium intracellulare]MCA2325255.1 PPE family protein [Mycobacterium intracellulare]
MDYGALPPEVNSSKMYSGPGSASMLAAADAWDNLATELNSSASAYRSVIGILTVGGWQGPSSAVMSDAVAPYVAWMHSAAVQAEQSATQARTAAAAYQTAFSTTVPPALIAYNRTQLASLVRTNYFGQNSPAIAATEADYDAMWAQDAEAMYNYAGSSASAAQLTPFGDPPRTTNPDGQARQAAAVNQASGTPAAQAQSTSSQALSQVHNAVAQDSPDPSAAANPLGFTPADVFGNSVDAGSASASVTSSSFSGSSIGTTNHAIAIAAERDTAQGIGPFLGEPVGPLAPTAAGPGGPNVSAAMGRATLAGGLSVPQTWSATATPVTATPAALAAASAPAATAAPGAMPATLFGESLLGTLAGRAVSNAAAKKRTPSVVPRSPAAG